MNRVVWIILGCSLIATSHAASFNCEKASSSIEKSICLNPKLSKLDEELDKSYKAALNNSKIDGKESILSAQKLWLRSTRNQCSDETCLVNVYTLRIKELNEIYPFFGTYESISRVCEGSTLTFLPATISLDDCGMTPYIVIESDVNHIKVSPNKTPKCSISIINIARQFPLSSTEKQPIGFGNIEVDGCTYAPASP